VVIETTGGDKVFPSLTTNTQQTHTATPPHTDTHTAHTSKVNTKIKKPSTQHTDSHARTHTHTQHRPKTFFQRLGESILERTEVVIKDVRIRHTQYKRNTHTHTYTHTYTHTPPSSQPPRNEVCYSIEVRLDSISFTNSSQHPQHKADVCVCVYVCVCVCMYMYMCYACVYRRLTKGRAISTLHYVDIAHSYVKKEWTCTQRLPRPYLHTCTCIRRLKGMDSHFLY